MSYLGNDPSNDFDVNRYKYVAGTPSTGYDGSLTTFPCVYDKTVELYVEGIKIAQDEFTHTSGVDITIPGGVAAGTIVEIMAFSAWKQDNHYDIGETDTLLAAKANIADIPTLAPKQISKVASSVLLNSDSLAIDTTAITKGRLVKTYTGTGVSNSISTGVGTIDLTDNVGYTRDIWHDRATGDCVVKVRTLGSELATNGTFDVDLSGWGTVNASWVSGRAYIDATSGSGNITQSILTIGKFYEISADIEIISGSMKVQMGSAGSIHTVASTKNIKIVLEATGVDGVLFFSRITSGDIFYVDNVSVKEVTYVAQESGEYALANNAFISDNHIKALTQAYNNFKYDGLRGVRKEIYTDLTLAEAEGANSLESFTSTGITLGTANSVNQNGVNYVLYQTIYTHIKWGLTSQGKRYIEAFNPITRKNMTMYEGSGIAGHQIPHSLGRELDFVKIKGLDSTWSWIVYSGNNQKFLIGESTSAEADDTGTANMWSDVGSTDKDFTIGSNGNVGTANQTYIMYGQAKSKNWTIQSFQGQNADHVVELMDVNGEVKMPSRVAIKSTSDAYPWMVFDNKRTEGKAIFYNRAYRENDSDGNGVDDGTIYLEFVPNGVKIFNLGGTVGFYCNNEGSDYIIMAEFDTNGDGGDSLFDFVTDGNNLNLTSSNFLFVNGKDENGYVQSKETFTGSIDFTGVSDGLTWVAREEGLGWKFYDEKPYMSGSYNKENADDNRLVLVDGKLYNTIGGELISGGTFDSQADVDSWTASERNGSTSSSLSLDNNTLRITNSGATFGSAYRIISTVIGEKYKVKWDWIAGTVTTFGRILIGSTLHGGEDYSGDSVGEVEFTASSTTTYIEFWNNNNNGGYSQYDNISVYKKEATLGSPITTPLSFIRNPIMVASGTPQYVDATDSLPEVVIDSLEVQNYIKASEFIGKNVCTAWVNFDASTMIKKSDFNISSVLSNSTKMRIVFREPMDTEKYSAVVSPKNYTSNDVRIVINNEIKTKNYYEFGVYTNNGLTLGFDEVDVHIYGGKL